MNQEYKHFSNLKVNDLKYYAIFQLEAILSSPYPILLDTIEDVKVQNFHL